MDHLKMSDYPQIRGFSKCSSAIFGYNHITKDMISELLPDIDGCPYDFNDYLNMMEKVPEDLLSSFFALLDKHKGDKIWILGDYDCDGISASVIMSRILNLCGYTTGVSIPNRFSDGYGMKRKQIDEAIQGGAKLVITVDNGITCNDAIDYAKSKNIDVIVTDHHLQDKDNPVKSADLIIDPWIYDSFKFKEISGAMLAGKLAYELSKRYNICIDNIYDLLFCAGISCLSDCMSCLGENRVLLKATFGYGNTHIYDQQSFVNKMGQLVGFYREGQYDDSEMCVPGSFKDFNVDDVDFYYVPIINSVNRVLGDVSSLVDDILSLFDSNTHELNEDYVQLNQSRKFMKSEAIRKHKEDDNFKAVVEVLSNDSSYGNNSAGINGLVASYVVESEHKPALIGTDNPDSNGMIHFSGRSVSGFDLYKAFSEIKEEHPDWNFVFGGHAEAMGLSAPKELVPDLQQALSDKFELAPTEQLQETVMDLDPTAVKDLFTTYNDLYPFAQNFEFPEFYYAADIGSTDDKTRTFTMYGMHGMYPIKVFDFNTWKEIKSYRKYNKLLKCVIKMMMDTTGKISFKLSEIVH
jgi:single-stranded-DNA-specific exonuclease